MDKRSFESPMEYEYQDRQAQIPRNSAFSGGTRTLSGQGFASPEKPLPAPPSSTWRRAVPQTPAKSFIEAFRDTGSVDFSSGASNPSSPDNGDAEDTPDPPARGSKLASRIFNGSVTVARKGHQRAPSKGKTAPTAVASRPGATGNAFGGVGGGTAADNQLVRRGDAGVGRPCKRKRQESEPIDNMYTLGRDWDGNDSSRPNSAETPYKNRSYFPSQSSYHYAPASPVSLPQSVATFLHAHPRLPDILATWVQLGLSTLYGLSLAGMAWVFISYMRAEIDHKADDAIQAAQADIALCASRFRDNGCSRPDVGPEFKQHCDRWAACAGRDARKVGRASISAGTMAEILNAFFEPLSWKLISCLLVFVVAGFIVPQLLANSIRACAPPAGPPPSSAPPTLSPAEPRTPSRFPRYHDGDPFSPQPFFSPRGGQGYERDFYGGPASPSPSRRMVGGGGGGGGSPDRGRSPRRIGYL